MHKSVSLKLVNIIKCHLVETERYLFIYLFFKNWMMLKDGYNYCTIHHFFSQATGLHVVTGPISLSLSLKQGKIKVRSGITDFCPPVLYTLILLKNPVWFGNLMWGGPNYAFSYIYTLLCQSLEVAHV